MGTRSRGTIAMLNDRQQSNRPYQTYLGCRGSFLCVVATLGVCGLFTFYFFVLHTPLKYARVRHQIDASIRNLKPSRPADVNQAVWECSRDWIITAYCNICASPRHTSLDEMYRLQTDVRKELEGQIDLGTLERLWARLGSTGPHGHRYIARYEASFQHCFSSDNPTPFMIPADDKSL